MKTLTKLKSLGGVAALVTCIAANSEANLLIPGTTTTPIVPEIAPALDGATLLDTLVSSYSVPDLIGGNQSGTLTSWVYSGNPLANGGLGGLTFVYQLSVTGNDVVETLALNNFLPAKPLVDVSYVSATGVAPNDANWSINGTPINFGFQGADNIPTNASSALLIINTSDQGWTQSTASVIDSVTASTMDLSPVPEPTTVIAGLLLLLPLGISSFRILRNRKLAVI